PRVSNLNYRRKDTVSNAVLAKVGSAGRVCIYSTRATNLVVDVNGYVADGTGTNPVTPARLADTRSGRKRRTVDGQYEGLGKLGRGAITEIRIAGRGGVPDTGVGAVLLNVTALKPTGRGSVTVFPCGQERPLAANLNHRRKRGTTNAVLARLGDGGKVCFHTSVGTHLVVDVHGWFDLPPNQPESDVVVLDDEPFEFESISGGDSDPIGSFDEEVDNPEIVRITTEEPTLVEGDTVVLSKPSGEPYYGEVTSVAGTSVIAEEVSLAEVLPTMDVSLESDMDGNVSEIVGGEAVSNFVIDRGLTTANEDSTTDFKCTAEATVDFTASAQVDVARFVFDVSFNIFDGLTAARIGFNPTLRAEVTATASAKASCEVYKELYKKELPTIKFLVGPVPVWITQEVTVGIGAEVSAEAAGSISLVGEASAFAGIVFEDGQWDRRTTITTNFSQQVSEDVVISATISAPVITYGARAYGIAGFDVAIAANLQLTYRPLAKKVLTLTTFVDLRISLVVKLDLVVTGLHWQFDFPRIMVWGPLELWSYSQAATNCDRSTIPEAQCEALVELWDQAGGRDWADAATWVSDDDPCGWEGVTCSGSNVTALDLSNKGVNGPVPTVFGGLTTLETLDLSSDTGFAPNTIDSIPASIADLDALRILDLANTGLTAVPPEIGGLARLRKLELSDNALTSLPETIGTLRRLRSLILDGNPLVSLPREIGDLSNLRTLRVERAPLTNLPTELSELTALVDLFVSDTPIQQVPYLGNATNLFAVFLGGTDITELPGGFENLTSLFVLNAENTGIRALPIGLGASPDLFQLQLRNTAIDSDITETMRRIQQTAPEVAIWLTSSGCPIVTDPAVRAWLDGQVVTNHEGPGSSHVPWDSNCSA
ncbi:MAG: leucine-rich repeat domain-containing protein, partial [Acidimicrobiales bacterium]